MNKQTCPQCGDDEHVIALEDGVWMCTDCTVEFGAQTTRGGAIEGVSDG